MDLIQKRALGIADDIYGAGLLFAYLAFVPFCGTGIMDSFSLQRLLEDTFQLDLQATREYCLEDDRLLEAVRFLDLGDGASWELIQYSEKVLSRNNGYEGDVDICFGLCNR